MRATFDTDDTHPRHRIDVWRATLSDNFIPIQIENYDRPAFSARYETVDVGSISLSRLRGTEQTFLRPPELIHNRDADFYIAAIHRGGTLSVDHNGQTEHFLEGSISLFDVTKPYWVHFAGELDIVDVFIPRADLDRALGSTRAAVGLSIGSDQLSTAVIRDFFAGMMKTGDGFTPAVADRMATVGVELIAAGFAERLGRDPPKNEGAFATVCRAKSVIDSRLGDPQLNTLTVAHELKLSPRRLQEVFRAEGLCVDSWIWERRLAQAYRLLSDPACGALAVATIAYRCGFTSQAHFARRFKQRFGQCATDLRSMHVKR